MNKGNKQSLIRIVLSILIILSVSGIWYVKNSNDKEPEIGSDHPDFVLEATEIDMEQLKSYGLPIIIDFGADSCDPCKEMAPVLKELNEELRGKAIIKFVDVRKYPEAAKGYPLSLIPTQMFFDKDGKPYTPSDPAGLGMTMYQSEKTNEHVFTMHEGGMTKEQLLDVLIEMGLEE